MHLVQIGVIRSPYKEKGEAPFQGRKDENLLEITVSPKYLSALKDVETISHLIILYWCHRADRNALQAHTPWDDKPHGIFATRSPNRPNPIAFCIAELVERKNNVLIVKGLDALDQTPLLDIKPYSSEIDAVMEARMGWLERASRGKRFPSAAPDTDHRRS